MLRHQLKPTIHDFAVLLGVISLLSVQLISFSDDPGVGWHLKTGELILSGKFPYFDSFLHSVTPKAWIADQWLSDLVLAVFFDLGGFPVLYALLSIYFLALFFWFCWREARIVTGLSLASTIAVLVAFKLTQVHFILRPVIFSFGFFAVVYFWLSKKSFDKSYFTFRDNIYLFLIFLLWANFHPSFILGFLLFGIFFLKQIFEYRSLIIFKSLLKTGCLILAASLINPYAYKLHESIINLGSNSYFMQLHQEWLPVNLNSYPGALFIVTAVVSYAGLVCFSDLRRKLNLFSVLPSLIFFGLCFSAVRFLPYFALSTIIIFTFSIGKFCQLLQTYFENLLSFVVGFFVKAEKHEFINASRNLVLILGSLVLLGWAIFFKRLPFYVGDFGPASAKFPYSEVQWLISNAKHTAVVLAPPRWGGFITLQANGKIKPILDDRNTLVGEDRYRSFYKIGENQLGLSIFLEESDADYLLLPKESQLLAQARELSSIQFEGDLAVVLRRD
ncbi:MAG: hypothetical protein R3A13_05315 [Bdellovibrionota bacterium]